MSQAEQPQGLEALLATTGEHDEVLARIGNALRTRIGDAAMAKVDLGLPLGDSFIIENGTHALLDEYAKARAASELLFEGCVD